MIGLGAGVFLLACVRPGVPAALTPAPPPIPAPPARCREEPPAHVYPVGDSLRLAWHGDTPAQVDIPFTEVLGVLAEPEGDMATVVLTLSEGPCLVARSNVVSASSTAAALGRLAGREVSGAAVAIGQQQGASRWSAQLDPSRVGSLPKSHIDAVIRAQRRQVGYCYNRRLGADKDLGGYLSMTFVIAESGSVRSADVRASTLGDDAVGDCVAAAFRKLQFEAPEGGGIVIVTYPFWFAP